MAIVARLMCSPMRMRFIKFSCRNILPMQSRTHGKYLSSDQWAGKWIRDHSSTGGRIIFSTILPTLGWPPLIWDQWYWSGTSGRSCTILWHWLRVGWDWSGTSGTYSETDFVSVQYWSGTSESGTYYDADFGSVETSMGPVVHSLRLRYWSGTSGRSGTYYEADFGSAETGLGPVVCTLRLTLSQWRMILV